MTTPANGRTVLTTGRLRLREMTAADAPFMVEILNDEAFLRYIGDRGVRNDADARRYLEEGAIASYREHGYGMYLAETREDGKKIGLCGLVRRDGLDAPDLGFALLPPWRGGGYAVEAAEAVLEHARRTLGLRRILAIATPDNESSARLLRRLGMRVEDIVRLPGDDTDLELYSLETGSNG